MPIEQEVIGITLPLTPICSEVFYLPANISQSKAFFDLPTETKMLAPHPPGGSHHRGYSGLGVEKVSQHVFDEEEIQKLRQVCVDRICLSTSAGNAWAEQRVLFSG